jgi:hypothetical protein
MAPPGTLNSKGAKKNRREEKEEKEETRARGLEFNKSLVIYIFRFSFSFELCIQACIIENNYFKI